MRAIRSGRWLLVTLGTLSAGFANDVRAQDTRCEREPAEEFQRQAEQKLVLLERLIGDTEPAKRVDASGDADAIVALADARRSAGEGRRALEDPV